MPSTKLSQTVSLLYRMHDADTRQLETDLLNRSKAAWRTAMTEEATRHGVNVRGRAPSGDDLAELRRMARRDAESIARTYNRDVTRAIERIYADNPRANRYTYMKRLEQWNDQRNAWKAPSIAITNEQQVKAYAAEQFRRNNNISAQFVFTGPPPVCKVCVSRFGAGVVDERYRRNHPDPAHPACPHFWVPINPEILDPAEAWVG